MKYLSLILLGVGPSLVAAANGPKGPAGGQSSGNTNANGDGNTNNSGMTAQGSSSGQMQAGGIANGGMSTGNMGASSNTGATGQGQTGNGNTGTSTSSAPGNAVSAANVPPGTNPFQALASSSGTNNAQMSGTPALTDTQKMGLQMAANLWAQDTAVVSSALSVLAAGNMSDQDFRDTADMAYMAEVNELMQKNYIDALLSDMPQLQAASTSLGNGSFAIVVDQLREMRIRGPANQTFVNAAVSGMNNLRCRQVLLAIDTYVSTANMAAGNNTPITATRPPACQQVYQQTADTLPAGSVTNATTFPNANQLITQFNQPPRFMLSNAVAMSQNSGSDNTAALGSQLSTNAPFTNTSSLSGQLLAFNGQPVMTNGDATNTQANPLNAVLFPNNKQNGGNTGNTGNTGATGQGQTGQTGNGTTGNTGASGQGETGQGQTGNTGASGQGETGQGQTGNTGASGQGQTGNTGASGQGETGNANRGGANAQGETGQTGKANGKANGKAQMFRA